MRIQRNDKAADSLYEVIFANALVDEPISS
jgi:hypothetical protein